MDYATQYELLNRARLKNRVMVALWRAAVTIKGEAPGTPNHGQRLAWAQQALRGTPFGDEVIRQVIVRLLGDPSLVVVSDDAQITDADLQALVNAAINDIAA